MIQLKVTLQQFKEQGEKTGWTYIEIPSSIAQKLSPGNKKSFRVMGKMDGWEYAMVALIPMGDGDFILPFNAEMRKATGKKKNDSLLLELEPDHSEKKIDEDLLNCLSEEESALQHFLSLTKGHQNYYSNWVESAKSANTKADRITKTLFAMMNRMEYGEMIRHFKKMK